MQTRIEHDLLGDRDVPAHVYWGVHTLRAVENFPITAQAIGQYRYLVKALGLVKKACALTNHELGDLDEHRLSLITNACDDVIVGKLDDQFVVDVIQGGAGTSTNMNANEVIANRALEYAKRERGDYAYVHPLNHVNMSQSTNDVYPTALRVAACFGIEGLLSAMAELRESFAKKAVEFADVLKIGRTQLQDAVPMTLGQEFSTYAIMLGEDELRLKEAISLVCEVNLGATAIGTGINTHPDYSGRAIAHLAELANLPLVPAANLIEATQDMGAFVQLSGVLKRVATKLSKVCNDLRLLSSGPQAGLNEIRLPARAAGSSIMPGKVNPIIPEVVNQVAFEVIGNDVTISFAAEGGQLQLNAFEPIIAHSLFKSVAHLQQACLTLARNCVNDIEANREALAEKVKSFAGLATALNPYIGYENATKVATTALQTNRDVASLVLEMNLLPKEDLDRLLRPEALTSPGLIQDLLPSKDR